ncbi:MAG: hypothetical protein ACRCVK_17315 [Aeromonas veronii]
MAARGGVQRGEGAGRIRRLDCLLQGLLDGGGGRASFGDLFRRAGFGGDQRRRRSSLKENGLMPYGEMPTYIALNPEKLKNCQRIFDISNGLAVARQQIYGEKRETGRVL